MKSWIKYVAGGGVLLLGVGLLRRRAPCPPFLVMGDSIAVGVGRELEEAFPDRAWTAAHVGEGIRETRRLLEQRLAIVPEAKTVVLSTGTNSIGLAATTEELLEILADIVETIRSTGRRVVVLGPPPAGEYDAPATWHQALDAWALVVSTFRDSLDLWALLGDSAQPRVFAPGFGSPDGLHPNRRGYAKIAQAITGK